MIADGREPFMDYCLRSAQEQKVLFDAGLSKCDGYKILSAHQKGLALDIYFVVRDIVDFGYETPEAKEYAAQYHDLWVAMGGRELISWDLCHYEGTTNI
jgi:hypothetical protein